MSTANHQSVCPRCGGHRAPDAAEGLCPRCLGALNVAEATVWTEVGEGTTGVKAGRAGPAPAPATPAELAPYFPQLEILECLGRGGMGVVYKARQRSLGRWVALKLLAPGRDRDPQFAERFAREARTLASLSHPNLVTVHDFGESGGMYYLLMEYVDGVNLRQAVAAGRFAPEQALAVVPPICAALQYAHDRGVVHRDIKPENLLLDREGRVKIADFGVARLLGEKAPATAAGGSAGGTPEAVVGTPRYMAPEQAAHPGQVDHRADIYALGVVLYELLTGAPPPARLPLEPPSHRVRIDVRLDEVVLRALAREPELRYRTAAEFGTRVGTVAAELAAGLSSSAGPGEGAGPRPRVGEGSGEDSREESGACRFSTPGHLRGWRARLDQPFLGRARWVLAKEALRLETVTGPVAIPYESIRGVGLARASRWSASRWPGFGSVTWDDGGTRRTVWLLPTQEGPGEAEASESRNAEWNGMLRARCRERTGREPAGEVKDLGTATGPGVDPLHGMVLLGIVVLPGAGMLASALLTAGRAGTNPSAVLAGVGVLGVGLAAAQWLAWAGLRRWGARRAWRVGDLEALTVPGNVGREVLVAGGAEGWAGEGGVGGRGGTGPLPPRGVPPWVRRVRGWSAGRRRWVRGAVWVVALGLTVAFALPLRYVERGAVPADPVRSEWRIGGVGEPWLREWQLYGRNGMQSGVTADLLTGSFACGPAALLAWLIWAGLLGAEFGRRGPELWRPAGPGPRGGAPVPGRVLWRRVVAVGVAIHSGLVLGGLFLVAAVAPLGRGAPPVVPQLFVSVMPTMLVLGSILRQRVPGIGATRPGEEGWTRSRWRRWVPGIFVAVFMVVLVLAVAVMRSRNAGPPVASPRLMEAGAAGE